jgi:major membrane immunogen (membrane-anchored lipoprotein)
MPYRNRETYRVVVRDSNNSLLVMNVENEWVDVVTGETVDNPKFPSMSLSMMTDREIESYIRWVVSRE